MNAYKDRIAETERVKERKRARVERGAGDVPMMSRCWVDRHEESRMKDIHIGKRGSETASEEQPDNLRKTVRFAQKTLRVHRHLPFLLCLLSLLRVVRNKIGRARTCAEFRSCR